MHLTLEPLDDATWPGGVLTPDHDRAPSRFSASWSDTLVLLEREVDHLANGGRFHTATVLEVPFSRNRLRGAGRGGDLPKEARHPGVAVSFDSETLGPLRFAADHYRTSASQWSPGWRANVRAIALTLEALRTADRHGVTRKGEQYRGWQAISAESTVLGGGDLTRPEAARVLADAAGYGEDADARARLLVDPDYVAKTYHVAARQLHPDHGGPGGAAITLVTAARDTLVE